MSTVFFYLPFFYTLKTRLNGISKQFIAWLFTFIMPVFSLNVYVFMHFTGIGITPAIIIAIIGMVMTYDAYEIGYIINDAEVTKQELNPTLRLNEYELEYYEKHKLKIYSTRMFILGLLFGSAFVVDVQIAFSALLSSVLILIAYGVYNNIRNRWNIPIYAALVYLRYFGLVSFFIGVHNSLFLFVVYPLLCLIEFSRKSRFGFQVMQMLPKTDWLRFWYYIAISPLICGLSFIYGVPAMPIAVFAIYFFFYRFFSLSVSKLFR